jgi:hypothetical protein
MSETTEDQTTVDPPDQEEDPRQQELEERARRMGWRPRESFRGAPESWLPPEEFVERGEQLLPLLQERNRAADRTITDLQVQIKQQGETLQTMLASTRRAEQAGYRRAMQELHQQRMRAVETGDAAAFQAVEQAMRELGPPPPEAPAPPQAQPQGQGQPQANQDPVILAWVRRNPWFTSDPIANVAMIAAMQQEERTNPQGSVEDHLLDAERAIERRFPEHFASRTIEGRVTGRTNGSGREPPRLERRPLHVQDEFEEDEPVAQPAPRRQTAAVARSSDSPPARRPGPRSFEAMPRDVQAQYERQRRMLEGKGEPLTKEEFASYYWEAEGEP